MSTKERINLVVSTRTRSRIEELQERLDSATLAEVIKTSVHLLDVVTERQIAGDKFILHKKDGSETELTFIM